MKLTRLHDPRAGVRVEVEDAQGRVGRGEVFPLEGRPHPSADGILHVLGEVVAPPPNTLADAARAVDGLSAGAAFALETALLDLLAQRTGRPVWSWLDPERKKPGPVVYNALIETDDADEAAELARRHVADGATTLKVKLGTDLAVAHAVRAAAPRASLRFDVNGRWSLLEATAKLGALAALRPEYVEQPVAPDDLSRLPKGPVPLAADESLALPEGVDRVLRDGNCAVLVLKPAVLGGALRCRQIARRAAAAGVDVVVTHSKDGPVALEAARQLAWSLERPRACGLM